MKKLYVVLLLLILIIDPLIYVYFYVYLFIYIFNFIYGLKKIICSLAFAYIDNRPFDICILLCIFIIDLLKIYIHLFITDASMK